ncbi:universal stress protein [Marinoscillum sp.]|uniref:universal stress protein n=1 Tax=Marinoscillum sp. TaxID=2024838 RepID=UPI003BA92369
MKKILVPTDFSECANNATDIAIDIAKHYGAELHFYHFVSVPIDWVHLDFAQNTIYPDVTQEVDRVQKEIKKLVTYAEGKGVKAYSYVDFDNSTGAVATYAKKNDISFIVMGSHGAKGIQEFFLGSNAQKVVRYAEIPVLIVKTKLDSIHVNDILFVSDFQEEMTKPFEHVIQFAKVIDAKIHLVYLNTPSDFQRSWVIRERMESFEKLASGLLAKSEVVNCLFLEEGMEQYCKDNHIGMIAMATHHRKGLSRTFLGSLTEEVVNHMDIPVVSFPI